MIRSSAATAPSGLFRTSRSNKPAQESRATKVTQNKARSGASANITLHYSTAESFSRSLRERMSNSRYEMQYDGLGLIDRCNIAASGRCRPAESVL